MSVHLLHFDEFSFDPTTLRLTRDGRPVPLRPQSARALGLLLRRAGKEVSRETLRQHLWGSETYVDFETGLNTCIRRLRTALGEDAGEPHFIRTIPGRGYSFIAAVRRDDTTSKAPAGAAPPAPAKDGQPREPWWTRRRTLRSGSIAASIPLALWLAFSTLGPQGPCTARADAAASDGGSLVVLGTFQAEALDGELRDALTETFRLGLEQSPRLRILPPEQLRATLSRMTLDPEALVDRSLGLEIGRREGAEAAILAGIRRIGESFVLQAEVIDTGDGTTLAVHARVPGEAELLSGLDRLIRQIHRELNALPTAGRNRHPPLARVTTADLEALRAYTKAGHRLEDREFGTAAALLERALELDPEFAMAHGRLGALYRSSGRPQQALIHLRAAQQLRRRLTAYEEIYVTGWLAMLEADADAALRAWLLLKELFPNRPVGHLNYAMTLQNFRADYGRCIETVEEGRGQAVGRWAAEQFDHALLLCRLGAGDAHGALEAAGRLESRGSYLDRDAYVALIALRRYTQLEGLMAEWETSESWSWKAEDTRLVRGLSLADQGAFRDAFREARGGETAADETPSWSPNRLVSLVYLEAAEDSSALRGEIVRLAAGLRSRLSEGAPVPVETSRHFLALLGTLAARNGQREIARDLLRQLDENSELSADSLWRAHRDLLAAEIAAAEGDLQGAVETLNTVVDHAPVFPLHVGERLAYWLTQLERHEEARELDRWIVDRRGRALAECLGSVCVDRAFNVVAWGRAAERLRERAKI